MSDARLELAVRNNAVWCDAVCRAHGARGEFWEDIWIHRRAVPRFYPNAVTLAGGEAAASQVRRVRDLVEAKLPGEWGVKDSFAALDLAAHGFRVLFEARWLYLQPGLHGRKKSLDGLRWTRVTEESELAAWEAAWGGVTDATPERVFSPGLLAEADIAFLAAYEEGRLVGGAIANRSGEVAGVSNFFAVEADATRLRAASIAAVTDVFPGLPLVGYEAGPEIAEAQQAGFEVLAPLRVWLRITA